jgi:site-specific DNA-methyltransferase (adenine-specific)
VRNGSASNVVEVGDFSSAAGRRRRGSTATSTFGVGRREGHDASGFYARFNPPVISDDDDIVLPATVDQLFLGDARQMSDEQVADRSVALVVTSPPYFAGKDYEAEMGQGVVPGSYIEYLEMLRDVFAACVRKLEPGGRMAVNVANLGRRPYRSLSGDVITILQDDLGLLLRGEIIWVKGKKLGGSCAWGSFQSAANPVLRDVTERIVVASKGRFDRAITRRNRARQEFPSDGSLFSDDFMDFTTDVWDIPPESATRVGHPAPFPVELPQRLIHLYTYYDDLVLDPFMGSGTTAVAAVRNGRHFVGFDTEDAYVQASKARVAAERERLAGGDERRRRFHVRLPARPEPADPAEDPQARAVREGRKAKDIARAVLDACGFSLVSAPRKHASGVEIDLACTAPDGSSWWFDVSGGFTSSRAGLRRTDTLWKSLGKAALLGLDGEGERYVLLTTHLPPKGSAGWRALQAAVPEGLVFDAVEMLSEEGRQRLADYASMGVEATRPEGLCDPAFEV